MSAPALIQTAGLPHERPQPEAARDRDGEQQHGYPQGRKEPAIDKQEQGRAARRGGYRIRHLRSQLRADICHRRNARRQIQSPHAVTKADGRRNASVFARKVPAVPTAIAPPAMMPAPTTMRAHRERSVQWPAPHPATAGVSLSRYIETADATTRPSRDEKSGSMISSPRVAPCETSESRKATNTAMAVPMAKSNLICADPLLGQLLGDRGFHRPICGQACLAPRAPNPGADPLGQTGDPDRMRRIQAGADLGVRAFSRSAGAKSAR